MSTAETKGVEQNLVPDFAKHPIGMKDHRVVMQTEKQGLRKGVRLGVRKYRFLFLFYY